MRSEPILIGADVGTTNMKVVAFDKSGRIHRERELAHPHPLPEPGQGRLVGCRHSSER